MNCLFLGTQVGYTPESCCTAPARRGSAALARMPRNIPEGVNVGSARCKMRSASRTFSSSAPKFGNTVSLNGVHAGTSAARQPLVHTCTGAPLQGLDQSARIQHIAKFMETAMSSFARCVVSACCRAGLSPLVASPTSQGMPFATGSALKAAAST
jgi:hypothetical protein